MTKQCDEIVLMRMNKLLHTELIANLLYLDSWCLANR